MEIPVQAGVRRLFPAWMIPAALLVCLIPFYWVSFWVPAVGLYHDDGVYLVTAKALAESKGYRIISLPDQPRQTKYPFGFPALLAVVWRLFPNFPANVPVLKIVPLGALLGWLGMAAVFARRWGKFSPAATLWLVFICAGTPSAVLLGTNFMSDILFGALELAALHFLLKLEGSGHPLRTTLMAAAFCVAGYFVRTAGVAVMAGGCIALLFARRIRSALLFGAVSAVAVVTWVAWQHSVPLPSNAIERYYSAVNYTDWNLLSGHYSLHTRTHVLWLNCVGILVYPLQVFFSNQFPVIFGVVTGWPMWAIYVRGIFRAKALRPAHLSFGIYVTALLLYAWPARDRFLVPFLPVLLTVAYMGLPPTFRRLPFAIAGAAAILFTLWGAARYEIEYGVPARWDVHWASADTLARWIKDNTSSDAIVLVNPDPSVYLYTGHTSIRPFVFDNLGLYGLPRSFAEKEADFREIIRKTHATYILRAGNNGDEPEFQHLVDDLLQDGKAMEVRKISEDYAVYRITGETPSGTDSDGPPRTGTKD